MIKNSFKIKKFLKKHKKSNLYFSVLEELSLTYPFNGHSTQAFWQLLKELDYSKYSDKKNE